MLRSSIVRAASSTSSALQSSAVSRQAIVRAPAVSSYTCVYKQQSRQAHAISNPTLADIEKRWEAMPPQEQADLWMALRDRMKTDWHELTLAEKKAAYWIAFGPHGPRAEAPPGENWKVFLYTMYGVAASAVLFGSTRYFAKPAPRTMSKEWQEATNEWLKEQNSEAITGVSSENYKGPGQVQSKATGLKFDDE
ncbi:COX4-domain-containing protein [Aulographum hederae CBS 113979]|uniref:Cytochrome c oxidase polypeptide V n=1 Tax=Aulographum hederae CBS 113979 TaxID=1176131 RepID=A0A6G1HBZ2_9PEZI|nr:COX4-domain-containing protein [Aulographum hederae CBS 113979]